MKALQTDKGFIRNLSRKFSKPIIIKDEKKELNSSKKEISFSPSITIYNFTAVPFSPGAKRPRHRRANRRGLFSHVRLSALLGQ